MTEKTYEERRAEALEWREWILDEAIKANLLEPPVVGHIPADKARAKDAEWYRVYTPREMATIERKDARLNRVPEYFNPIGDGLWNGGGRVPAWWLKAIEAGYTREQMRIVRTEAA